MEEYLIQLQEILSMEIEIALPSLPEQEAIAEVLSSLDDKIELLHKQNKTLESMAQTLFREWFIEDAKEGCGSPPKIGQLESIINVSSGKYISKNKYVLDGNYPIMGANGEIGRTNSYLFNEKLIFTGRVGTLGKIFILTKKAWISDNTLIIKPQSGYFYYVYYLLKKENLENLNIGSTQPLIKQSDLKNILCLLPDKNLLKVFEKKAEELFDKVNCNQLQIHVLDKLRDILLPKLINSTMKVRFDYE